MVDGYAISLGRVVGSEEKLEKGEGSRLSDSSSEEKSERGEGSRLSDSSSEEKSVVGEGSVTMEVVASLDSLAAQPWRMLDEAVKVTEITSKVFYQGEWGQGTLSRVHAEWASPKAKAQVCDHCRRTGFLTFDEAWCHKVHCQPEAEQGCVIAALTTPQEVGSEEGLARERQTLLDVVEDKGQGEMKSRQQQEEDFMKMLKEDLECDSARR